MQTGVGQRMQVRRRQPILAVKPETLMGVECCTHVDPAS
jgi:hypothetical protein